jgi:hypothetical protein
MVALPLDRIRQQSFDDTIEVVPPPAPLRRLLQRSPLVKEIADAARAGQITEAMIREFASSIFANFEKGRQHRHDLALAGVAVALETVQRDFAEEFLHDLARLSCSELGNSIRVARECLKARLALPKTVMRKYEFPYSLMRLSLVRRERSNWKVIGRRLRVSPVKLQRFRESGTSRCHS